jgi:hypothetical protein
MKHIKIALVFLCLPLAASAAKNTCTYSLDSQTVKVGWTAFKTSEKTPVKGILKDINYKSGVKPVKSLNALLSKLQASGQIDNEKKSDSGNPARDTTLFQKFFSMIAGQGKFQGSINHFVGDDKTGAFNLQLTLNGSKKEVPMKYTLAEDGTFEANGEFDMNHFGLAGALASLHEACEALHKGKDGVSKTWPNVGLNLTAKIVKDCTKK